MIKKIKLSKNLFLIHGKTIEGILRLAVRKAIKEHKRAGNPIAAWKNGKVVLIPPEKIPVRQKS